MTRIASWRAAAMFVLVVTSSTVGQEEETHQHQHQQENGQEKKAVVCYYASWAYYKTGLAQYRLDNVPVQMCTHMVYAFAVLDPNTFQTVQHDPWLDDNLGHYDDFVRLKDKNPDLKVLLGLGGWVDSRKDLKYSRLVEDPVLRRRFVTHVVDLLLRYGFDGLDLDWEFPGWEGEPGDKDGFSAWVRELREAFDPHGLILTSSVSAGIETIDRGYDIPAIAPHLDLILLMSYDFHGNWEMATAHPSPLAPQQGRHPQYNVMAAVDHLLMKGADPRKMVIGIPFYGVSWTLAGRESNPGAPASRAGRAGPHYQTEGKMAYYEVCLAKMQGGWSDFKGPGGSYMVKGDQWVAYDDIDTLKQKAQYVKDKGLAGVMIWDVTTDDFGNQCGEGPNPLLTAITDTLQDSTPVLGPPGALTPTPKPLDVQRIDQVQNNVIGKPVGGRRVENIDNTATRFNSSSRPSDRRTNQLDTNVRRFNASTRAFTLSPCIVRYDGTRICPDDFIGAPGVEPTSTATPLQVRSQPAATERSGTRYAWQDWPIFSKTTATTRPDTTTRTTLRPRERPVSSTTPSPPAVSPTPPSTPSPTPPPPSPPVVPPTPPTTPRPRPRPRAPVIPFVARSRPTPSPASAQWFESCLGLGFASDPGSCGSFFKCTNNYAYKFQCPAGLVWRQDPGLCDWPYNVQCEPTPSPLNLEVFLPPLSARFQ